jgi:hypothetical protein
MRDRPALPRPEDAGSWGEFNARYELELSRRETRLPPRLLAIGGLFDATIVIIFGSGHWWLLPALGVTGVIFALLGRTALREGQTRARDAELSQLRDAWLEHLHDETASW